MKRVNKGGSVLGSGASPLRTSLLKRLWDRMKGVLGVLFLTVASLLMAGLIGWAGIEMTGSLDAWQAWLYQSRFGFLAWRLCVYAVITWLFVQLFGRWRKTRPSALPMLRRMGCFTVLVVVLGEYSLHLQWEAYTR